MKTIYHINLSSGCIDPNIVRIDFVEQIELYEKDSYIIKLKNNQTIPVSKSGYNRLRTALNF